MRRFMQVIGCTGLGLFVGLTIAAAPQSGRGSSGDVIAATKAEWKAFMENNPSGTLENIAEDCTIFRPGFPTRFEGKEMNRRWTDVTSAGSGRLVLAEMTNELVQTYGNVKILSYNFIGATQSKDGVVEPMSSKSTRVYVKQGNDWKLVHANFAPVVAAE